MLIYSDKITPRLKYAAKLIFTTCLNSSVNFTKDASEFADFKGPKINYSKQDFEDGLKLNPVELLFEKDIFEQEIHLFEWSDLPVFFKSRGKCFIPFDIFAASFYLVSRYEEYLPFIPDHHGRFTARESLAHREGFLQKPLVNLWALGFLKELQKTYSDYEPILKKFEFTTTIDVDNIFAYLGKGGFRTLGGIAKDLTSLNLDNLSNRLAVLSRRKSDPYDTFDWQQEIHNKYDVKSIYFMLFSEFSQYDRNVSMYHRRMRSTVKHFNDYTILGIHPSYLSNASKTTLENEKRELESLMGRPVIHSRQHFLKMQLPKTLRMLSNMGIKHEYTMGYAWEPGFRASICSAFPFYDLEMEIELPLMIHPFAFMDMTFINYKNMNAEDSWVEIKKLIDEVKKVNGELISIWHNRTFSEAETEWRGFNKVYEDMLEHSN